MLESGAQAEPVLARAEETADGCLATYDELLATEPLDRPGGELDRVVDLTLAGTGTNGESWPDADPLPVTGGECMRPRPRNTGATWHPMHLNGHHFQVRTPSGRGPVEDRSRTPSRCRPTRRDDHRPPRDRSGAGPLPPPRPPPHGGRHGAAGRYRR